MGANQSQSSQISTYPRRFSINSSLEYSENEDFEGGFVPREGYQNLEGSVCEENGAVSASMTTVSTQPRSKSLFDLTTRSTLKVVHEPIEEEPNIEMDATILRLNQIPMAFKILDESAGVGLFRRRSTHSPGLTRPLNSKPLLRIGTLYSEHIKQRTLEVTKAQSEISKRIKETNSEIAKLLKTFLRHQSHFAYCAKKLEDVNLISKTLSKCQGTLDSVIQSVQALNEMLPDDEKLEPLYLTDEDSGSGDTEETDTTVCVE